MTVSRWIQMSFFVMLMLQFTVTGQFYSFPVRDGDDVTLSCEHVRNDQDKCNRTIWMLSKSKKTIRLFEYGKIKEEAKSQSDRLSVTENCSLVIKKVTDEDVGRYACRQFDKSGRRQYQDSVFYLSVVTRTEHKDHDKVTLNCSVWTHGHCRHTVKWLYDHNKIKSTVTETPQSFCSATVTFTTSDLNQKYSDLLKCEVTHGSSKKVQQFTFRPQKAGDDATTSTKSSTMTLTTTMKTKLAATVNMSTSGGGNSNDPTQQQGWSWWYIPVAVASAALVITIITVVAVIRWKKTKGKTNKPQLYENVTEPDDGVYINYIKKSKRKAWGQKNDKGKSDAVSYSTVKVSSSSGEASTDPTLLYAAINTQQK